MNFAAAFAMRFRSGDALPASRPKRGKPQRETTGRTTLISSANLFRRTEPAPYATPEVIAEAQERGVDMEPIVGQAMQAMGEDLMSCCPMSSDAPALSRKSNPEMQRED